MIRRRLGGRATTAVVLVTALSVAMSATTTRAQTPPRVHRVGLLMQTTPAVAAHIATAFTQGLRDLGHVEDRDVVFEYRWAEGKLDRLPALAAELVGAKVDLIIASSLEAAEAARRTTTTIPIVMVNAADPVESGLVRSLARPGGNVTGLSASLTPEIRAKQLQLLKEALPALTRVAIVRRAQVADAPVWKDYETAGQTLKLKIQFFDVRTLDELPRVFESIARERIGAVLMPGDPVLFVQRQRITALMIEQRLPAIFSTREFAQAGGLMSYSARLTDQFRRAAVYADKILKGANPATLPVEQPTQFELVINLKTAKALRLTVPQTLLVRADEVIQ
jgi:putative ABC transport system substrate-binding protein